MAVPKQPQLPLLPVDAIILIKYRLKINRLKMVNGSVKRFRRIPNMSNKPIKNSKPIIKRAIKGAIRQLLTPISTKVN